MLLLSLQALGWVGILDVQDCWLLQDFDGSCLGAMSMSSAAAAEASIRSNAPTRFLHLRSQVWQPQLSSTCSTTQHVDVLSVVMYAVASDMLKITCQALDNRDTCCANG